MAAINANLLLLRGVVATTYEGNRRIFLLFNSFSGLFEKFEAVIHEMPVTKTTERRLTNWELSEKSWRVLWYKSLFSKHPRLLIFSYLNVKNLLFKLPCYNANSPGLM